MIIETFYDFNSNYTIDVTIDVSGEQRTVTTAPFDNFEDMQEFCKNVDKALQTPSFVLSSILNNLESIN